MNGLPTAGSETAVEEEQLLLSQANGRQLVEALGIPELEVEIERAIFQVEAALDKGRQEKVSSSKSDTDTVSQNGDKKDI